MFSSETCSRLGISLSSSRERSDAGFVLLCGFGCSWARRLCDGGATFIDTYVERLVGPTYESDITASTLFYLEAAANCL